MPEFIRTSALWIHLFKPCNVLLLSLTNIYLTLKQSTDPVSETLKGDSPIFWEDKMIKLCFSGKTKCINSREKSMKFSFKAYLGKNSSASSSLCNKWNTLHWKAVKLSHCLDCLSRKAGQAQDLTKMLTQVGWPLCSSLVGTAFLKSPGYNLS